MKTIKNDYCIRLFTNTDPKRPAMSKVHKENGYLYATNGYLVAKVKSDLFLKEYTAIENYPNAEAIYQNHKSFEKKTLSVDKFMNDMMHIECCFKPKMIACTTCDGEGESYCNCCGHTTGCNDCMGSGEMPGKELELSSEQNCNLFNRKYNLHYLDLILRTAVYIGVTEIQISNPENRTYATLFTVGDFSILLMPIK